MSYHDEGVYEHFSSRNESEWPDLKDLLIECIEDIHTYGSFATSASFENFVNPGIEVHEVGSIRLPLSSNDAQSLIRASRQAPFGKGTQTLVDETVRKTWEIDGSEVSFSNKAWHGWMEGVIHKAAEGLGVAGGPNSVRAELYKMLLYEKGAMFKPHKDSEKTSGMFGTLVICLPSEHVGGAVRLTHGQEEKTFDTAESSAFNTTYMAWYADVSHEIEPVKSGYRWVLTYNLIDTSVGTSRSAARLDAQCDRFCEPLAEWRSLDQPPKFLFYPFEHQYTEEGLKLGRLKGEDYHRARYVADACNKADDFCFLLASMQKVVTWVNDEGGKEAKKVEHLLRIVDIEGFALIESLRIAERILVVEDLYDDRNPDAQDRGEYLGNSHDDISQTYNDSGMLIGPKASATSFLLGSPHTIVHFSAFLQRLIEGFQRKQDQQCHELMVQTCQNHLAREYYNAQIKDLFMGQIAIAAIVIANRGLFSNAIHSTIDGFNKQAFFGLGRLMCFQTPVVAEDDLIQAFSKIPKLYKVHQGLQGFRNGFSTSNVKRTEEEMKYLANWIKLRTSESLKSLSGAHPQDGAALIEIAKEYDEKMVEELVKPFISRFVGDSKFVNSLAVEMLSFSESSAMNKDLVASLWPCFLDAVVSQFELQEYCLESKDEKRRRNASNVVRLVQQLLQTDEEKASKLLRQISLQSETLSYEELDLLVIPLLEQMLGIVKQGSLDDRQFYRSMITTYIIRVVRQEPKKPSDWARLDEKIRCYEKNDECPHCRLLEEFFQNPDEESRKFVMTDDSKHMQYSMPWQTEKSIDESQTPPVLIVTKTLQRWENDHEYWLRQANRAQETLKRLPQDDLKRCLGQEEYDALMDLRPVKVSKETICNTDAITPQENTTTGNDPNKVTVPQKRPRSDS